MNPLLTFINHTEKKNQFRHLQKQVCMEYSNDRPVLSFEVPLSITADTVKTQVCNIVNLKYQYQMSTGSRRYLC